MSESSRLWAHMRAAAPPDREALAKQALREGKCPECSSPLVRDRGNVELGGRCVSSCPRCSWDDWDLQEAEHRASLAVDADGLDYEEP
jgi:hypothetical protein